MSEVTFACSHCGNEHPISEQYEIDGELLCASCAEEQTVVCDICGIRIWRDSNSGNENMPLCERCYDRSYSSCIRCGALVHNDDANYAYDDPDSEEPLCSACYARIAGDHSINDYYYKPEPIFYGDGDRYFGVELEIDGAGELSANAKRVLDIGNADEEHIYCKHDGSLNDGFEIVTHPMTCGYHLKRMPWRAILDEAIAMGYQSHKSRTCGLHVHVSRSAFGPTEEEQDACIARVLYFFEKHWEELLKFSRRTELQLKRWAARYGYKEQPKEILDRAKSGYGGGRYSCVNLQNRETVEFRIFRGTLKLNTIFATLQLIDKLCDVAISLSDDELKALSWTSFVAGIKPKEMPELIQYLKERCLYINEPVEAEVEL